MSGIALPLKKQKGLVMKRKMLSAPRFVMRYQDKLVEVLGEFTPKIVRMCGDDSPAED